MNRIFERLQAETEGRIVSLSDGRLIALAIFELSRQIGRLADRQEAPCRQED